MEQVLVAVMPTKGSELAMSRLCWVAMCVYPGVPLGEELVQTTLFDLLVTCIDPWLAVIFRHNPEWSDRRTSYL